MFKPPPAGVKGPITRPAALRSHGVELPPLGTQKLRYGEDGKPVLVVVKKIKAPVCVTELDAVTVAAAAGRTKVATCTAIPLDPPYDVTVAVRAPVFVDAVVNDTVSCVAVAALTVPTAPKLSTTVFPPAGLKPVPIMTSVRAFRARLAVLRVTVGRGTTVATWTGAPLDMPLDITDATNGPSLIDDRPSSTVSWVADPAITTAFIEFDIWDRDTMLADGGDTKSVPEIISVGAVSAW